VLAVLRAEAPGPAPLFTTEKESSANGEKEPAERSNPSPSFSSMGRSLFEKNFQVML
jgi:hypothetical protein